MMQQAQLEHLFVEHIPDSIEDGILYLSLTYGTTVHRCCCGCGEEVVTPITPTDWKMIFDGETVSLHPSIGSWSLPCRSHYVIKRGRVIEAAPWSDEQVSAERRRDRKVKAHHYGTTVSDSNVQPIDPEQSCMPEKGGFWHRVWLRIVE